MYIFKPIDRLRGEKGQQQLEKEFPNSPSYEEKENMLGRGKGTNFLCKKLMGDERFLCVSTRLCGNAGGVTASLALVLRVCADSTIGIAVGRVCSMCPAYLRKEIGGALFGRLELVAGREGGAQRKRANRTPGIRSARHVSVCVSAKWEIGKRSMRC